MCCHVPFIVRWGPCVTRTEAVQFTFYGTFKREAGELEGRTVAQASQARLGWRLRRGLTGDLRQATSLPRQKDAEAGL